MGSGVMVVKTLLTCLTPVGQRVFEHCSSEMLWAQCLEFDGNWKWILFTYMHRQRNKMICSKWRTAYGFWGAECSSNYQSAGRGSFVGCQSRPGGPGVSLHCWAAQQETQFYNKNIIWLGNRLLYIRACLIWRGIVSVCIERIYKLSIDGLLICTVLLWAHLHIEMLRFSKNK